MSRFRGTKFRNVVAKAAKKEQCFSGLQVPNLNSFGDHVAASCRYLAFNWNTGSGGSLAVLGLDDVGKKDATLPLLNAHSSFVSDFQFSPFDDHLLATGSEDCTVKIWHIPDGGLTESLCNAQTSFALERKIEALRWHPAADGVLATAASNTVKIWDVERSTDKIALRCHEDNVASVSWRESGQLLASSCKDKKLRLLDVRGSSTVAECIGHNGVKEARVVWLGDRDQIISTGFNQMRDREIALWDTRNFNKPVTRLSLGTSTGSILPFFDDDTGIIFLLGKGDCSIRFLEIADNKFSEGQAYSSTTQQKGGCLVPKRALNVMVCEVGRVLQLSQNAITPIGYYAPRKSYSDFSADIFPDTLGGEAAMTAEEWFGGANNQMKRVSLDPSARSASSAGRASADGRASEDGTASADGTGAATSEMDTLSVEETEASSVTIAKPFSGVRSSKVRHWQGTTFPKTTFIDGVKPVCNAIPGDSDGMQASRRWAVVPLAGVGGQLTVLDLNKPGRRKTTETTSIPVIQNGCPVQDFVLDPFDDSILYVAGDDGKVNVFNIPEGGLVDNITKPERSLRGHYEKVNIIACHPFARSVLATASFDLAVKVWDTSNAEEKLSLTGHPEQIFSIAWSQDGCQLATYCKDHLLRIYDPRQSSEPIKSGKSLEGSRGGRVVWIDSKHIAVSGFDKTSQRIISLYLTDNLNKPMHSLRLDVSPSILQLHYDADRHLLFYYCKGESTVSAAEVSLDESPYLFETSRFKGNDLQQGISFQPIDMCDVKAVEFARLVRFTNKGSVEPVKFSVPRTRVEFFQDDLFPPTCVTWESALGAKDWFAGKNCEAKRLNLQPKGMKPLSEAPKIVAAPKKFASYNPKVKTDEEKKEELLTSMVSRMTEKDDPLPQDDVEGVDEDEWD